MTESMWKMRVAVLWIFLGVATLTSLVVYVYEPETVRGIIRGDISGVDPGSAQAQMYMALQPVVCLAVAFTTLTVGNPVTNRKLNGALGLLAAIHSSFLLLRDPGAPSTLVVAVILLVSLLVLWHVWKWPVPDRAASSRTKVP